MNTENPDQTPTPRKHLVESAAYWFRNAFAEGQTKAGAVHSMENAYNHVENALAATITERDTASAEAKEAENAAHGGQELVDQLRAEVARLTKERDALRVAFAEASHNAGPAFVAHEELNRLRTELATLRATTTQDHGAAIEASAYRLFYTRGLVSIGFHELKRELRALVATVTNSQQKGGEEPVGAAVLTCEVNGCFAGQSDPKGAATVYEDWHEYPVTPAPTLEKLAQEIDDLYEAPSRIRLLRRILEREFGASRSVSEVAKEIVQSVWAYATVEARQEKVESILSRLHEHELRELREECERLRKDKDRIDELIRLRAIWSEGENQDGEKVKIIYGHRDAIDGAIQARAKMQPGAQSSEETKP